MKKLIVVAAVLSLVSVNMFADYKSEEHFTITKGDVSWIKENAYANLMVDLSNALIVKCNDKGEISETLGLYKEYYDGGEENMHKDEESVSLFCSGKMGSSGGGPYLNKYMKKKMGIRIVVPEKYVENMLKAGDEKAIEKIKKYYVWADSPVKYKIVVSIDKIDVGNSGSVALNTMVFKRVGECVIWGKIIVINNDTGDRVFEASANAVRGFSGINFVDRLSNLINTEIFVNDICVPAYGKK